MWETLFFTLLCVVLLGTLIRVILPSFRLPCGKNPCYRHGYLGEVGGPCRDSQGKLIQKVPGIEDFSHCVKPGVELSPGVVPDIGNQGTCSLCGEIIPLGEDHSYCGEASQSTKTGLICSQCKIRRPAIKDLCYGCALKKERGS